MREREGGGHIRVAEPLQLHLIRKGFHLAKVFFCATVVSTHGRSSGNWHRSKRCLAPFLAPLLSSRKNGFFGKKMEYCKKYGTRRREHAKLISCVFKHCYGCCLIRHCDILDNTSAVALYSHDFAHFRVSRFERCTLVHSLIKWAWPPISKRKTGKRHVYTDKNLEVYTGFHKRNRARFLPPTASR